MALSFQKLVRQDYLPWLCNANLVLLITYTLEAVLRMFIERVDYVFSKWNHIDLFLVVIGWLSTLAAGMVNLTFLRFLRIARLLRAARVLMSIREFYLLLTGFISSLRAIFFGSICLAIVLGLWAIFVVQIVHPINASITYDGCERCADGFRTVQGAMLTLFQQVVAGDSWGAISVPVIEKAWYTAPILMAIVITVSLGVMNLILAVIVERATEARENDQETKMRDKKTERRKNMINLATLCAQMDADGSGTLSVKEMVNGYNSSKDVETLFALLGLDIDEIDVIFAALDEDRSGDVSYFEFCKNIDKAANREPQMMQALSRFAIAEVKMMLEKDIAATLRSHTQMLEKQTALLHDLRSQVGIKSVDSLQQHCQGNTYAEPNFKFHDISDPYKVDLEEAYSKGSSPSTDIAKPLEDFGHILSIQKIADWIIHRNPQTSQVPEARNYGKKNTQIPKSPNLSY